MIKRATWQLLDQLLYIAKQYELTRPWLDCISLLTRASWRAESRVSRSFVHQYAEAGNGENIKASYYQL